MLDIKSAFKTIVHFFLDIVETIVVALALFVIIYMFLVQPHQVNGDSMFPNFHNGEYLLTDKLSYRFNTPERGDVIIFHAPPGARCPQELQCDFVKRIIGLPHEVIEIKPDGIFINSEKLNEFYLPNNEIVITNPLEAGKMSFTLNENEFFVMGDNRLHSSDSRAWGAVPLENIVGKAWIRYWPPKNSGFITLASFEE